MSVARSAETSIASGAGNPCRDVTDPYELRCLLAWSGERLTP